MTIKNEGAPFFRFTHVTEPRLYWQGIKTVRVVKRALSEGTLRRFGDIELRIGDNDESGLGNTQFRFNPLVGYYPGNNIEPVAIFGPLNNVQGRFLTLQRISIGYLDVAEIYVFN